MMSLPPWLTGLVAGVVLIYGVFRIKMALWGYQAQSSLRQHRGLYGMSRKHHILIGIIYLILGGLLMFNAMS